MNGRLVLIILTFSLVVEGQAFMELAIYDEIPDVSIGRFLWMFTVFALQTFSLFLIIFYLNIRIINWLESRYPWDEYFVKRIILEFTATSLVAVSLTVVSVVFVDHGYLVIYFEIPTEGMEIAIYYNLLYTVTLNTLFVIMYEAVFLYTGRQKLKLDNEMAQKRQIITQFEALRNQVNPHFLFNSLNSLIAVIREDPARAVHFVEEFTKVYRYMLTISSEILVAIRDELEFVKAYVFLQKLRFEDHLEVSFEIPEPCLDQQVPPFSLQILIENAIKHNRISSEHPLKIVVRAHEEKELVVENNIQPAVDSPESTRVGLKNLRERYRLLSDKVPEFVHDEHFFKASLPILTT